MSPDDERGPHTLKHKHGIFDDIFFIKHNMISVDGQSKMC